MRSDAGIRLGLLLIGALLLRAGWGLRQPADDESLRALPDQREYLALGRNLLDERTLKFHDDRFNADVYAYRTPGYPLLVAACGANVRAVRLAQALIDTSTVLAAYLLARRWLARSASFFAAFLVAVNPFLIYFSGLILSETLFVAMLSWGMFLVSAPIAAGQRTRGGSLAGSLILPLSLLVRPSALLLPVLIVITKPRMILFTCAMMLIALLPWAWRNHNMLGRWIWTTTNSGITLYDGFNPAADGSSNQNFVAQMPELKKMNEMERSTYLSNLAMRYARENPMRAIALAFRKIARTWCPIPLSQEYGSRKLYVIAAALYSVPLDLLILAGLLRGSLKRSAKIFLMLPAIYLTSVHAMSVGSLRYRLPAELPMAVIAASCQLPVTRKPPGRSQLATDN